MLKGGGGGGGGGGSELGICGCYWGGNGGEDLNKLPRRRVYFAVTRSL